MTLSARMVTIDCATPAELAPFWIAATGYEVEVDFGGFFMILAPPGGRGGLKLGLQMVPEERVGKNRVHIDWDTEDREAEVDRLVELGATVVAEHPTPGLIWTVLADPVGNEFCVAGHS
jgi:hypothetical protein